MTSQVQSQKKRNPIARVVDHVFTHTVMVILLTIRNVFQSNKYLFAMMGAPAAQPILEWAGRHKAYAAYKIAKQHCPAYQKFLAENPHQAPRNASQLALVPYTDKPNYVKRFKMESRCCGGEIDAEGVKVDTSSGSSGAPNFWPRGKHERADLKRSLQRFFELHYRYGQKSAKKLVLLNCFALGPWATGQTVHEALIDVAIMHPVGVDKEKLQAALNFFDPKEYTFIVLGYPPFIREFVDTTSVDLTKYELHAIVGGEAISEPARAYLKRYFQTVYSSFGASDLEINLGLEHEFSIWLRQQCIANPELSERLFGRKNAPMIFQYNAADYRVDKSAIGELIFTVNRSIILAPKIRYNLKDEGGSVPMRRALKVLKELNIDCSTMPKRYLHFPLLYLFGRSDLMVTINGCNIYPDNLQTVLGKRPDVYQAVNSYQLEVRDDDPVLGKTLTIHLERTEKQQPLPELNQLADFLFTSLKEVNQDFRESFREDSMRQKFFVVIHDYAKGPFEGIDKRVKNPYTGKHS